MSANDRGGIGLLISFLVGVGLVVVGAPQKLLSLVDDRPSAVRAVYALPAGDIVDPDLPAAIRNEISVVQAWFEQETDGRSLRFAEEGGRIAVEILRLETTAWQLQGHSEPFSAVKGDLFGAGGPSSDELLLVFVPVVLWSESLCGQGSTVGLAVVWSCSRGPLLTSSAMGHGTTHTIAHELVHALGGVQPCAPNYDGQGHVTTPDDVLAGRNAQDWVKREVRLDPGRDDYYGTGGSCGDISKHPAWK